MLTTANQSGDERYAVQYVNCNAGTHTFPSFIEAFKFVKKSGFETIISRKTGGGWEVISSWHPLNGLTPIGER